MPGGGRVWLLLVPSPMCYGTVYIHVRELMQPSGHTCSASQMTCDVGVNHGSRRKRLEARCSAAVWDSEPHHS